MSKTTRYYRLSLKFDDTGERYTLGYYEDPQDAHAAASKIDPPHGRVIMCSVHRLACESCGRPGLKLGEIFRSRTDEALCRSCADEHDVYVRAGNSEAFGPE